MIISGPGVGFGDMPIGPVENASSYTVYLHLVPCTSSSQLRLSPCHVSLYPTEDRGPLTGKSGQNHPLGFLKKR